MIIATIQVSLLVATTIELARFSGCGQTYRPFISTIAAVWAGLSLALAVHMLTSWSVAVTDTCLCKFGVALVSAALVFWGRGNVAEIGRKLRELFQRVRAW